MIAFIATETSEVVRLTIIIEPPAAPLKLEKTGVHVTPCWISFPKPPQYSQTQY